MKKIVYLLILPLVVVSGVVFASREITNDSKPPTPRVLTAAEQKAAIEGRKQWEATPDGLKYKVWESSPEGKKVNASYIKIQKNLKDFTNMEAMVTSVTFQREGANASSPKWLIVSIDGEEYMMQFIPNEFRQLQSLQVGDKIIMRSHSAGNSPNHPYLILSGDYIEHNNKELFKRDFSKNKGC